MNNLVGQPIKAISVVENVAGTLTITSFNTEDKKYAEALFLQLLNEHEEGRAGPEYLWVRSALESGEYERGDYKVSIHFPN